MDVSNIIKDWREGSFLVNFDKQKRKEVRDFFDGLVKRLKTTDSTIGGNFSYYPFTPQSDGLFLRSELLKDRMGEGYPLWREDRERGLNFGGAFVSMIVYVHSRKGYLVEQRFYFGYGFLDMKRFFESETQSRFDPNDRDGRIEGRGEVCFSELIPNLNEINFEGLVEKYYEKVLALSQVKDS